VSQRYFITSHKDHQESTEPMFCFIGERLSLLPIIGIYPGWTTFDAQKADFALLENLRVAVEGFGIEVVHEEDCQRASSAQALTSSDVELAQSKLEGVPILRYRIEQPNSWQDVVGAHLASLDPTLKFSIMHAVRLDALYLDVFPVMRGVPYRDFDHITLPNGSNDQTVTTLWASTQEPWKDFSTGGIFDSMCKVINGNLRQGNPGKLQASDVDDLTSEVMMHVVNEYASRPTYSLRSLCKLKSQAVLRDFRRRKPIRYLTDSSLLSVCGALSTTEVEESIDEQAIKAAITQALEELPTTYRNILTVRFVDQLTLPQIAAKFGIARSTVCAHLGRALDKLRRMPTIQSLGPVNGNDQPH
jgi:RNA polymerase sigma factor (sigma-70 family)